MIKRGWREALDDQAIGLHKLHRIHLESFCIWEGRIQSCPTSGVVRQAQYPTYAMMTCRSMIYHAWFDSCKLILHFLSKHTVIQNSKIRPLLQTCLRYILRANQALYWNNLPAELAKKGLHLQSNVPLRWLNSLKESEMVYFSSRVINQIILCDVMTALIRINCIQLSSFVCQTQIQIHTMAQLTWLGLTQLDLTSLDTTWLDLTWLDFTELEFSLCWKTLCWWTRYEESAEMRFHGEMGHLCPCRKTSTGGSLS